MQKSSLLSAIYFLQVQGTESIDYVCTARDVTLSSLLVIVFATLQTFNRVI